MANEQDPKAIIDALTRAFEVLKFTPEKIETSLNDIAELQQMAISTEVIRVLSETEVAALNKEFESKSDEEKKSMMEAIIKTHSTDPVFAAAIQAEVKKVLDEQVAYLKTLGDSSQQKEVAQILAAIA